MESVLLAGLRPIARGLPEASEEPAWVGTRWRVRGRTFAHALEIVAGRPPSHARGSGCNDADGRWRGYRPDGTGILVGTPLIV